MKNETIVRDVQLAKRAADRIIHLKDGSVVHPIKDGLYDLFQGEGFEVHSRFRIIKPKGTERKIYQVSGTNMSRDLCDQLIKEL